MAIFNYTKDDIKQIQSRVGRLLFKKIKSKRRGKALTDKEQEEYSIGRRIINAVSYAYYKRWHVIDTSFPAYYMCSLSLALSGNDYTVVADGETYKFNENDAGFWLWKQDPHEYIKHNA